MARVLWPLMLMATCSETPERTRLRTPVLRRAWHRRAGMPAALHAMFQAVLMLLIGLPRYVKTHSFTRGSASRVLTKSEVNGIVRPPSFLVSPGSRRTMLFAKSILAHVNLKISPRRHPVLYAN